MITPKTWGFEDLIVDAPGRFARRVFIKDGYRTSLQSHKTKDEVICVAEGVLYAETGPSGDELTGIWLGEQDRVKIAPGTWHRFSATNGDALLYEIASCSEDCPDGQPGGRIGAEEAHKLLSSYVQVQTESSGRIVPVEMAEAIASAKRAEGKTIGMCNGCFDLFHMGHIHLIREAKRRCEVLFVAINSDDSVRKLKGPSRPFVPEEARYLMVACTRFADYVVPIPDTTCLALVKAIKPDIYVTSMECKDKSPEAPETIKLGGRVEAIEMIQGFNTTKLAAEAAARRTR